MLKNYTDNNIWKGMEIALGLTEKETAVATIVVEETPVNVEEKVETPVPQQQEKQPRRVSTHIYHPHCQELITLLKVVDINTAQTERGIKVKFLVPLITDKERELVEAFQATDYNIKRTGEVLGFSHTNVWQRLYGDNRKAKGVLGKLREYANKQKSQEVREAEKEALLDALVESTKAQ